MPINAINDNASTTHIGCHDAADIRQKNSSECHKPDLLSSLRAELARLDPAKNGPVILQTEPQQTDESSDAGEHHKTERLPAGWLHELWAPHPRDHATAMAWALSEITHSDKPVLWITSRTMLREQGLPYGPGLFAQGFDPSRFILVRVQSEKDGLWALEEAIKSSAFAGIVGEFEDIDLTSSRRLSLAIQTHDTHCILLMRCAVEPQSVAYSRWRVTPIASATGSITSSNLPGVPRLKASLCKHRGGELPHQSILEWQDATHRFHMVTPMANQPLVPGSGANSPPATTPNDSNGATDKHLRAYAHS